MIWLNGVQVEFKTYPNGETLVDKMPQVNLTNHISFKYESDLDLVHLMFVRKHLDQYGSTVGIGRKNNQLQIQYMPYSRMDRTEGGSVFTLKHVTDFINWLGFDQVTVWEPHSDVTMALLDNVSQYDVTARLLHDVLTQVGFTERDYLFFPDAGAQKRYAKLAQGRQSAVGFKHRDFMTGELTGHMDVVGFPVEPWFEGRDRKVVIVDDLCSKGGTFVMAANALRNLGADKVYLLVAHCESTMWQGDLINARKIDGLFCTDSILSRDDVYSPIDGEPPNVHIYSKGKWHHGC